MGGMCFFSLSKFSHWHLKNFIKFGSLSSFLTWSDSFLWTLFKPLLKLLIEHSKIKCLKVRLNLECSNLVSKKPHLARTPGKERTETLAVAYAVCLWHSCGRHVSWTLDWSTSGLIWCLGSNEKHFPYFKTLIIMTLLKQKMMLTSIFTPIFWSYTKEHFLYQKSISLLE